jgi:molybdopterin/thiamine biosynthesis adenylyltransferase
VPSLFDPQAKPSIATFSDNHPWILDPIEDAERIAALRHNPQLAVCDSLQLQLEDLVQSRNPGANLSGRALDDAIGHLMGGEPAERWGKYVYLPWKNTLVHLLPGELFRELRTDRNRHKICAEDQVRLGNLRIAIAGLSVGMVIAQGLAMEGIGATFHLADFDVLSVSNLNRLAASVTDLGVNKAVLAARRLWEQNPYLEIVVFERGVTDESVPAFLESVDVLVEECDDLYAKVKLREAARERRLPVLMHTSERGALDVERYDQEPDRPVFHGLIGDVKAESLRSLTTRQKVPFVLRTLGLDLRANFAASLIEIKHSLHTWPQLASEVAGGAVAVPVAIRRIAAGLPLGSGRYYLDADAALESQPTLPTWVPRDDRGPVERADLPALPAGSSHSSKEREPNRAQLSWLIAHACLAPSGGNAQPWRFRIESPRRIDVHLDPQHTQGALDRGMRGAALSQGAVVEIIHRLAPALGFEASVAYRDQVARVHLESNDSAGQVELDRLLAPVLRRTTNRGHGSGAALSEQVLRTLRSRHPQTRVIDERSAMTAIGAHLGAFDRVRLTDPYLHADLARELRWTPDEASSTRDGIDVATLEVDEIDWTALRIATRADVAAMVNRVGGGRAFEDQARQLTASASAWLVIYADSSSTEAYHDAGRELLRVWLTCTELGVGVQPYGALLYALDIVTLEGGLGASDAAERTVVAEGTGLVQLLGGGASARPAMLLRLTDATYPRVLSWRRPPVITGL